MDIFRTGSDPLVGLDIGSHSVKVLQLNGSPEAPRIEHFAVTGYDSEQPEDVETAVKAALSQSEVRIRKVAFSVAGPSVSVRHLQFPKLSTAELKGAVWWEGEQVIPFSMDDVYTDFQVFHEDETSGTQDVLFVAVSKELVNTRTALVRACGLEPRVLDADGLAMVNGVPVGEDGPIAMVNIGARVTNLSIVDTRDTPFVRDILIAGSSFTEAISEAMEIPIPEAETLKTQDIHALSPRAVDEMESRIRNLTDEIATSLRYYQSRPGSDEVYDIRLTGGSAKLPNLARLMTDELGMPVEPWNPLSNTDLDPDTIQEIGPVMAVAMGLARRKDP